MDVFRAFQKFPEEAKLIGCILGGYTDLEIDLMYCVNAARNDFDTLLKSMYRVRGESKRVDVADAFGRQAYIALGFGAQFEKAIGAMRYCIKIRNQYAHCVWWDDNTGQLAFAAIEDIAELNEPVENFKEMQTRHTSVELLTAQFAYFEYTSNFFYGLLHEGNQKPGLNGKPLYTIPEEKLRPGLYL